MAHAGKVLTEDFQVGRASSQQNELRNCIGAAPDEAVLFKPGTEGFRLLKNQSEHEKAFLSGPFIGRVLADARHEHETAAGKFFGQGVLPG